MNSGRSNVSTTVETINPQTAGEWLERNKENRPLREKHIETLAKDMAEGRWVLNGEAIVFDSNGLLIDGQHRLWAAFEHQQSFTTVVVRGVDPEAYKTIDAGIKRTAGDALGKSGVAYGNIVASAIRLIHAYEHRENASMENIMRRMSNAETAALVTSYPLVMVAAQIVGSVKARRFIAAPAATTALVYFGLHDDKQAITDFIEGVASGAGLSRGDARLTARNFFTNARMRKVRLKSLDQFALLVKAWNAFREDTTLSVLKYQETEEFPVIHHLRPRRRARSR
jgi:hypothetical protein